ncbi:MAG: T9SS type A sorting domain-containing protein [Bacteroidetes bacterium]|nr:T9SS type A sorting domain-containing protein [Bacteroidota bacterium]
MKNKLTFLSLLAAFFFMSALSVQAQVTLTAPANGAVGVSIEPTFTWSTTTPDYLFEISTGTGGSFAGGLVYSNTVTPTTFDFTTITNILLNNTKYFWRVTDNSGGGTPSSEFSFTTSINVTPFLTSPISGSQINTPTVSLYWNVSGSGNYTYDVFYSTTQQSSYAGTVPALQGLTNSVVSVSGLAPGTTYYWQVRVKSSTGAIIGYSVVESFVTYGVLTEPIPIYPTDGSETYSNEPYLYWTSYYYSTVIQYKVRYSTSAALTGDILTTGTETPLDFDLYTQLTGLSDGTPYYWQVAASNDGGSTFVWSDVFSFTTPAATGSGSLLPPTPAYPTAGITVYSSSVTFYWQVTSFDGTMQYEVQYVKDDNTTAGGVLTGGASVLVTLPLTGSNFRQIAGLEGDATYYWQVRSYNGSTYSDWSVVDNFVTDESVLNVQTPILLTPYDGQIVTTLEPTTYWYISGNPNGYDFTIVYNDDGAQDISGNLTGTTNVLGAGTTSGFYAKFASALLDGGTYYWQVIASKGGFTRYSEVRSFTINAASTASVGPEIPIPTYPVGGFTVLTDSPVLNWVVNSSYSNLEFQVLYSTDNTTLGGELQNSLSSTTWTSNLSVALSGLTPGATYYWQVRSRFASAPATISDYSSVQYFVVSAGAGPSMAILGSPVYGETISSSAPVLSWIIPSESTSELTYEVEISEDQSMNAAQRIDNLTTNSVTTSLPAGKTYYWRVRSKTSEGEYSYYTGAGEFEIDANISAVEETEELPIEFKVDQNYPNPFNPSTTIKFAIPATEEVSVKIFDLLGREVVTLLSGQLEAGNHSVVWNGQNQFGATATTGIYFFRVKSGNNVVTKKMVLMK